MSERKLGLNFIAMNNIFKKIGVALLILLYTNLALADTITYFHNDISGSPQAATDESGALLWRENYTPYGDKVNESSPSGTNGIGFHGKPHDDSTGLSYIGARYYDPLLGRFMGIDPVGFQEENVHSFNRYAYANNNPYKYVDPDGRYAFLIAPMIYLLTALSGAAVVNSALSAGGNSGGSGFSSDPTTRGSRLESIADSGGGNGPVFSESESSFPDRELPRDKHGNPVPEPDAEGPHSQLGQNNGSKGKYDQAREFDSAGKPVRDIDFTDHGRPQIHTDPHQHPYEPNSTGGTPKRGSPRPL